MILYFSAKIWNTDMCYNIDGHQKHYAQVKKSNKNKNKTKKQQKKMPCMFLFVRHIQTGKSIQTVRRLSGSQRLGLKIENDSK